MRTKPVIQLDGEAARIFRQLRRRMNNLTASQLELLALFSVLRARHQHAIEKLRESGEVIVVGKTERVSPWLRVAQNTELKMLAYLKQLSVFGCNLPDNDPMDALLDTGDKDSVN